MLKNLLDMGMYLYAAVGIGILGVLILTVMNGLQKKKLNHRDAYEKAVRKLNTTTSVLMASVLVVTTIAVGTGFFLGNMGNRELIHCIVGLGTSILLMAYCRYLAFFNREQILADYIFRLVEQRDDFVIEEEPQPPTKEQLIERALRGIRESAAAGENKFAHLLSQEEESLMREVISEFLLE